MISIPVKLNKDSLCGRLRKLAGMGEMACSIIFTTEAQRAQRKAFIGDIKNVKDEIKVTNEIDCRHAGMLLAGIHRSYWH